MRWHLGDLPRRRVGHAQRRTILLDRDVDDELAQKRVPLAPVLARLLPLGDERSIEPVAAVSQHASFGITRPDQKTAELVGVVEGPAQSRRLQVPAPRDRETLR